jgi:hypothetical protein
MRGYKSVHVCDDPERAWHELAPHLLHVARSYASWSSAPDVSKSPYHGVDTLEAVKKAGVILPMTPEQAIELGRQGPIGLTPLVGGLKPELGWKSLEMFVNKVLPHIKDAKAKVQA